MISAKEKANEILDDFWLMDKVSPSLSKEQAKQCALITINALIKETGSKHYYDVKKELEKL